MGKLTKYFTALSALYSFNAGANAANYFNRLNAAVTEFFGIKIPLNEFYAGVIGTSLVCAAICGYFSFESAAADRQEKREANELRKYYSIDNRFRSKAEFNVKLPRTFF
jgi:hypothetical protein